MLYCCRKVCALLAQRYRRCQPVLLLGTTSNRQCYKKSDEILSIALGVGEFAKECFSEYPLSIAMIWRSRVKAEREQQVSSSEVQYFSRKPRGQPLNDFGLFQDQQTKTKKQKSESRPAAARVCEIYGGSHDDIMEIIIIDRPTQPRETRRQRRIF